LVYGDGKKMNKSRWDKYQLVEERHQGEKRMIIDDFEDYFHVKKEQFKNQVCLEIGCGVTGSIHYINDTKLNIGLDPLCSSCRDLYFRENTNNTPHITAIGEYLPVKNNVVDSIFIYGALDHCLSPNEVLKETN
jgi:ubiquinone/menaquinone biosynthesis C-methylase UbiE